MKKLSVKRLQEHPASAADIPALFDKAGIEHHTINQVNWPEAYPYVPEVNFRIAHTGNTILIEYSVKEDSVRAVAPHDNGHVWEDACCEFFSRPADDDVYYNIECNCSGTLLIGSGPTREGRTLAPAEVLAQVDRWSSLGRTPFDEKTGKHAWQLALTVPLSAFFRHRLTTLGGHNVRGNFYKCGDKLQTPHFLSWNAINVPKPDFHRPDFFGELNFE